MKKEKIRQLFGKTAIKAGTVMLAAAVLLGSGMWYESRKIPVPELVSYVDMEDQIEVEEEAVPLAKPKVTKSVKTTKSTKKIKMKKKSKRTYSKKGKTKKKTVTRKASTSRATTTTKTQTATTVTNKFKKGSYVKTQLTTVKTTVTKTVVEKDAPANKKPATQKPTSQNQASESQVQAGTYEASVLAPKADRRLLNAYEKLGFKIAVNPSVSYSGYFNSRDQLITLKRADATVYHELGHFLSFIAGNMDVSAEFKAVYNSEKSKYTASNKAYVLSSSSEYFAESYLNYVQNPAALKAERPQTFAAMEEALNRITDARVSTIWKVYSTVWKQ